MHLLAPGSPPPIPRSPSSTTSPGTFPSQRPDSRPAPETSATRAPPPMPRPDSTQSCWKPYESHSDEEYPCRDSTRPDRRNENSLGRYLNNVAEQAPWSWFRISLSNLRQPRFWPGSEHTPMLVSVTLRDF